MDFSKGFLHIPREQDDNGDLPTRAYAGELIMNLLRAYMTIAERRGGLGLKKENGFRELVQKDAGRFDLNLDHLVGLRTLERDLIPEEIAIANVQEEIDDVLRPHLTKILGDQYILHAFGAVVSTPDTHSQRWHVDSSHLWQANNVDEERLYSQLPCHFVTVFCPQFEYAEDIGPTQIALNSFQYTSILPNRTVEDQYPPDEVVHAIFQKPGVEVISFVADPGDIGIMDSRTLHRGGANASSQNRPLIYMSYGLPWYREFPQSQNEERSLFE